MIRNYKKALGIGSSYLFEEIGKDAMPPAALHQDDRSLG